MTKRRHRREFTSLSQTYRKELDVAQSRQRIAEQLLERKTTEYAEVVNKLSGYWDAEGAEHRLWPVDLDVPPENIPAHTVTVHTSYEYDTVDCVFRITRFLLTRTRQLDPHSQRAIMELVEHQLRATVFKAFERELGPRV